MSQQVTLTAAEVRQDSQFSPISSRIIRITSHIVWVIIAGLITLMTLASIEPNYTLSVARARASLDVIRPIFGTPEIYATYLIVVGLIGLIAFVSMAVLIYWQHGSEIMGYVVSLMLLVLGADLTNFIDALVAQVPFMAIPGDMIRSLSLLLPVAVLFLFPTGKLIPQWGRIFMPVLAIWSLVRPFLYELPIHPRFWNSTLTFLWFLGILGIGLAAAAYRYYRVSAHEERQQTRWIMVMGGIAILIYLIQLVIQFAVLGYDQPNTGVDVSTFPVLHTTYMLALLPVPIGLAVSLIRYRLWDLDLFINRSITYIGLITLLSVISGSALMISLIVLEKFTGQGQFSVAFAISATLTGLLIQPAYQLLKHFVDQTLYNIHLDYDHKLQTPGALDEFGKTYTEVGVYRHMSLLARGTLANVYTAWHPKITRPIIIKILQPDVAQAADFQQRFEENARQMSNLRHANIISIFDYGKINSTYYMALEYFHGETSLDDFIHQNAPIGMERMLHFITGIADALDYAHAQGVWHHDLKPSNVMLQPVSTSILQRPILMDFGLTRLIGERYRITGSNAIKTYAYLAPEQIHIRKTVDHRADIYALGMIAYVMSTRRIPFTSTSTASLLLAVLRQQPIDPCSLNPKLPDTVGQVILKALSKNPEDRFNSAGEFIAAIM